MIKKLSFLFLLATTAFSASAQNVAIADLQQDVELLKREIGQLRLDIEQLSRENRTLLSELNKLKRGSAGNDVVKSQISSVRTEVSAQNEALKREIISVVRKDMEAMTSQMNTAIAKLSKSMNASVQAPVATKKFSTDYPESGFLYTVKSGDTISKIAQKYNSKIKWIQDANEISDPSRGLKVGAEIVVPQKK